MGNAVTAFYFHVLAGSAIEPLSDVYQLCDCGGVQLCGILLYKLLESQCATISDVNNRMFHLALSWPNTILSF